MALSRLTANTCLRNGKSKKDVKKMVEVTRDLKTLKEITRDEWVVYHWIDVTEMRQAERMFLRGRERDPRDAARAATEWDIWHSSAIRLAAMASSTG